MSEKALRTFIQEITRRHELATEAMVARLDEQGKTLSEVGRAIVDALVDMRAEILDSRKQIQANTQAVLSVLDRLN